MRKQVWIGIAVTVTFAYFAFRGISFREVGHALSQARVPLIGIAILIYAIDFALRSFRWSVILQPIKTTNTKELLWVLVLGFFANNILPFRMGELARAHFCARKLSIPASSALGTIVMERLCDMISFLFVFFLASSALPFPAYMKKGACFMGLACLAAFGVLLFMHFKRESFQRLVHRSPLRNEWKAKLVEVSQHFTHSTIGVFSGPVFVKAIFLSFAIWTAEAGFLYTIAHALSVPLPFMGAFFLLFALGLSVALPQGPGYVGTFEFFGTTALTLLGIPKETGLPVILAVHGLQFSLIALLGTIGLWKENVSFKSLSTPRGS